MERDIFHPTGKNRRRGPRLGKSHGVLREVAAMKYAWIERNKLRWPVAKIDTVET